MVLKKDSADGRASHKLTPLSSLTTWYPQAAAEHSHLFQDINAPSNDFATVIEADHATLSSVALSILKPAQSMPSLLNSFKTLLWRLVRHDISEEIVMRPAFVRYMGDQGVKLADHDRLDHDKIKRKLLLIASSLDDSEEGADCQCVIDQLTPLVSEMAEHMREESGVVIPKFVNLVGDEVCAELGRRYMLTLILTPEMGPRNGEWNDYEYISEMSLRLSDVIKYANTEVGFFRERLQMLEHQAVKGVDGGYLKKKLRNELERLGLSLDQASGQSDASRKGKGKGKL